MLNVIAIMGRLTADPEIRQTTSGTSVTSFSIACDRNFSKDGEKQCDFFDVTAWRGTADFVCKYFQKGSMIAINGRLQSRRYTDKNGNNRTAIEIVADNVNFGGNKNENSSSNNAISYSSAPAAQTSEANLDIAPVGDDFAFIDDKSGDDDLPF